MHEEQHYKPLAARGNHNCFGCSPHNRAGLQMKFYSDGASVCAWLTVPEHLCGWDRLVHGGVISTILDETMGWTALHLLRTVSLTKSMKVEFLKPVYVGDEVKSEGRVLTVNGPRKAAVEAELFNKEGVVCARAQGEFALFTVAAMRRMGIMNEEVLKNFEEYIDPKK